jgi:hypothetical protein
MSDSCDLTGRKMFEYIHTQGSSGCAGPTLGWIPSPRWGERQNSNEYITQIREAANIIALLDSIESRKIA